MVKKEQKYKIAKQKRKKLTETRKRSFIPIFVLSVLRHFPSPRDLFRVSILLSSLLLYTFIFLFFPVHGSSLP